MSSKARRARILSATSTPLVLAVLLSGCLSPSFGAADVSAILRQSLIPAIGMAVWIRCWIGMN
jgi:hypothetical protein